jgi:hypothetical protein
LDELEDHVRSIGMTLSPTKTDVGSTREGFNLLGCNLRKEDDGVRVTPSPARLIQVCNEIDNIIVMELDPSLKVKRAAEVAPSLNVVKAAEVAQAKLLSLTGYLRSVGADTTEIAEHTVERLRRWEKVVRWMNWGQ